MSKIIRGTMLLTGASFLSKFLGMIYVIPFNVLVGAVGGALYGYAYTPYSIFLSISTVGIPSAVSKFISKYNSLGDYETGMRMFRLASLLMLGTGLFAFLMLYFSADWIAGFQIKGEDTPITADDVAFVTRMVSIALIIIPSMSILRGFFQGHQSMGPTAVSQVVEQIVRIGFILIGAYIIIHLLGGTIVTAVGFATFAAFIGAVGSCLVLAIYWKKRKPFIKKQIAQQKYTYAIPTRDLFKELFRYAGPFVLVGLAIPLYQLVDQFTFQPAMLASGREDIWVSAASAIMTYGHKVVIIPMTVATGLSLAMLPSLTESFTQKNEVMYTKQINQALQIILVVVIPASVGIAILSNEAYGALYGMENIGVTGSLLAWYAPVALLFALFTVTAGILQGIDQQNYAVLSLMAGVLAKVLLNSQLIHVFGAKGAIFGTALAAGIAVTLNLWRLKKALNFKLKQTIKRTILIGIFTLIMCIVVWTLKAVMGLFLPYETSRWATIVMLGIGAGSGAIVYFVLAYKSTLLEHIFGGRIPVVGRFLGR
ncbi:MULTISPECIES: putative polysaccharide biosynthesis protein [Oceanobacillus]|uniref:Polysaccharide biosynthesis protein n=1 Tax=Oceanobacillus profundus TaxID=372463 RepID=A0A417YAA6_9BACI|nr:polysaccharide biosynthesis protein [Oceanobacillus profundus]MBR3120062.1 polysaccharide biosynthesis protein [Oceanobacillus sp.]MCM3398265.1 polysaccharide biosynthesis protein [Oceanobacillus profundus]PAE30844.1 cell division protein [Paenibacillus sp. 7884-2]RHW29638.1 polysaccharide biosynthesis protein [Oceanobacillus profundus]